MRAPKSGADSKVGRLMTKNVEVSKQIKWTVKNNQVANKKYDAYRLILFCMKYRFFLGAFFCDLCQVEDYKQKYTLADLYFFIFC